MMKTLLPFTFTVIALLGATLTTAHADGVESVVFGMGCFWGAQKRMGALHGVVNTQVGYAGGDFPHPTYESLLSAERTNSAGRNHAEVVKVIFNPKQISLDQVLIAFWEGHDPTQGNRQGHDVGSNYRSAIYYTDERQRAIVEGSRSSYQRALIAAGYGPITTEIAALRSFYPAEDYHQDYLRKHPQGYCGAGGVGVAFPGHRADATVGTTPLDGKNLAMDRQLVMFEAEGCPFCKQFEQQILTSWQAAVPVARTLSTQAPMGWTLTKPIQVSPTFVLFQQGQEAARYTGYDGDQARFWAWLGRYLLTPAQRRIAYEAGTEPPFTGSLLDNPTPGVYLDPVSGTPLFRSDAQFHSGTGWPSFFDPIPGALTLHPDDSHGIYRVEVRSASSGIHLGHVFDDGPPPTGKRYCINSAVLRFVPNTSKKP
jgi:peptide methionine sulfoxide reductase msrA/msrB